MSEKSIHEMHDGLRRAKEIADAAKPFLEILAANKEMVELRSSVAQVNKDFLELNRLADHAGNMVTALFPRPEWAELSKSFEVLSPDEWRKNLPGHFIGTVAAHNPINLISGVSLSNASSLCQTLPVAKMFEVENRLASLSATALAYSQPEYIDEYLSNYKQSRIITSHFDKSFRGVKVDYDFSKVSDELEAGQEGSAIIKPQLLLTEAQKIRRIIQEIYKDNAALYKIAPREFEQMIRELLEKKGYDAQLTKQTRDGGYDILALSYDNGMPLKYLVECKKYKKERKVGIEIVRSFSDVIKEEQATRGIIFTTSYFTSEAHLRQKANPYSLWLNDHDEVINWVKDYMVVI